MARPAPQGRVVGIVNHHRCRATVALKGDMAVVASGIPMVQIDAIRALMTSLTGFPGRIYFPIVHGREIAVTTFMQVTPGNLGR